MNLEKNIKELSDIADKLEDKNVTLEESMRLFNDGIKKCSDCIKELNKAEGKIQELTMQLDGIVKTTFEVE